MYRPLEEGESISVTVNGTMHQLVYTAGSSIGDYLVQLKLGIVDYMECSVEDNALIIYNTDPSLLQISCASDIGGFSGWGEGYRYGFNGKEKDNDNFEGAYDFGARILDARLGRWMSVDVLAMKSPSHSVYSNCFNNPIKFVDSDGKYPLAVITNTVAGYTISRMYSASSGTEIAIVVPTYKLIVYDVDSKGNMAELGTFHVTRDGWYNNGKETSSSNNSNGTTTTTQSDLLVNRCSEPNSTQSQQEIPLTPLQDNYSGCQANYTFGKLNCEPIDPAMNKDVNGNPLHSDVARTNPSVAEGVMIHIGGFYTVNGTNHWGGTYGCYGIVDPSQVKTTEVDAEKMKADAINVISDRSGGTAPANSIKASNDEHNRFVDAMVKGQNLGKARNDSDTSPKGRIWARGWFEKTRKIVTSQKSSTTP